MHMDMARIVFSVITLVAVAGFAFRVATAPERIQARKATARSVCTESGGRWVKEGRDEFCVKPDRPASTRG